MKAQVLAFLAGAAAGAGSVFLPGIMDCKPQDGSPVRERVELMTYRTRKSHDGCGESREFWDEQWPKFEREWQVVK